MPFLNRSELKRGHDQTKLQKYHGKKRPDERSKDESLSPLLSSLCPSLRCMSSVKSGGGGGGEEGGKGGVGWWQNATAGAIAGFATVVSLHPLDVVRTRFQGALSLFLDMPF